MGNVEFVGVEVDMVIGVIILCWVVSVLYRVLGIIDGLGSVGVFVVVFMVKFEGKVFVFKVEGCIVFDGYGIIGVGRGG